jgi:hypothetical protein
MRLAYTLKSPADLYRKLERESYRAFHCENATAKQDHLYNFCVTAHALRDFFFKHIGISGKAQKTRHHKQWNAVPELVAAAEIANTSKHFSLDRPQRTVAATPSSSVVVSFYRMPDGQLTHQGERACDVEIALSDGNKTMMHEFTKTILDFWFRYLTCHGILVQEQSVDDLQSA